MVYLTLEDFLVHCHHFNHFSLGFWFCLVIFGCTDSQEMLAGPQCRLSCSELHSVQMELLTWFMAWDYFRVVALLPQALAGGNPGLVFESFMTLLVHTSCRFGPWLFCWFTVLQLFCSLSCLLSWYEGNIAGFLLCCWDLDLPCITTVCFAMIAWFLQELQMVRLVLLLLSFPPLNISCGCTFSSDTVPCYHPPVCFLTLVLTL